jgi:hypothetical protein
MLGVVKILDWGDGEAEKVVLADLLDFIKGPRPRSDPPPLCRYMGSSHYQEGKTIWPGANIQPQRLVRYHVLLIVFNGNPHYSHLFFCIQIELFHLLRKARQDRHIAYKHAPDYLALSAPTSLGTNHALISEHNGAMLKAHVYKARLSYLEEFLDHRL